MIKYGGVGRLDLLFSLFYLERKDCSDGDDGKYMNHVVGGWSIEFICYYAQIANIKSSSTFITTSMKTPNSNPIYI